MNPFAVELLPARAAAASPGHVPRGMSWVVIYLARMTSAVGTWMVTCRDGVIDPEGPLVYAAGAERGRSKSVRSVSIGGLDPAVLGIGPVSDGEGPIPIAEDAGTIAPEVVEWLRSRGCVTRMLLACQHEDEIGAVIGFTKRPGDSGFSTIHDEALAQFGSLVAHGLVVARHLERNHERSPHSGLALLSTREAEVAALAAKGATNPEIAALLGLSPGTIKSHMHRVYAKLGVGSRAGLALAFDSIPHEMIAGELSPESAPTPDEAPPDRTSP